jgi:hypothetical protein
MYLVGFVITIYHNAQSPDCQILYGCKWHLCVLSVEIVLSLFWFTEEWDGYYIYGTPCVPLS